MTSGFQNWCFIGQRRDPEHGPHDDLFRSQPTGENSLYPPGENGPDISYGSSVVVGLLLNLPSEIINRSSAFCFVKTQPRSVGTLVCRIYRCARIGRNDVTVDCKGNVYTTYWYDGKHIFEFHIQKGVLQIVWNAKVTFILELLIYLIQFLISLNIYRYQKLFIDIKNYLAISGIKITISKIELVIS